MGRYIKGGVDDEMVLQALNTKAVVAQIFDEVVTERMFVSSLKAIHVLSDFTALVDDGPIMVGVAHSDYSQAEIEAWIEVTGSWSEGDLVQQEVAKRRIRKIGIFHTELALADSPAAAQTLNDGRPITTKLGWVLITGQSLTMWAYNLGTSVLTTGALYNLQGHVNLWPR